MKVPIHIQQRIKPEDSLIFVGISQGKDGFSLTTSGVTTMESVPALDAAEFLAKYHLLANLFERRELFAIS